MLAFVGRARLSSTTWRVAGVDADSSVSIASMMASRTGPTGPASLSRGCSRPILRRRSGAIGSVGELIATRLRSVVGIRCQVEADMTAEGVAEPIDGLVGAERHEGVARGIRCFRDRGSTDQGVAQPEARRVDEDESPRDRAALDEEGQDAIPRVAVDEHRRPEDREAPGAVHAGVEGSETGFDPLGVFGEGIHVCSMLA